METTLPIVRKLLLLAGMGLVAIGSIEVVTIVLNPDWWRFLTQDSGAWFGGDSFLGNITTMANVLRPGAQATVWGLIAMGLGHMLPNGNDVRAEAAGDAMSADPSA